MTIHWHIAGGRILCPAPFCIAGILNATPDSFATGHGQQPPPEHSVAQGLTMLDELAAADDLGPGMLDIGAESTRPGAPFVSEDEESARLFPVLRALLAARPEALVSVDTTRAAIAAQALDMGAAVINDVSGLARDQGLLDVLAQYRPGYVLMHSGGTGGKGGVQGDIPEGVDVVDYVLRFFEQQLTLIQRAGLPPEHVVLDPGIGFGKSPTQNWTLLRELVRLDTETRLGRPLYVGLSMKSLFRMLPGEDSPQRRKTATQAAVALCSGRGVRYHRVHHVTETATTLRVCAACGNTTDF